MSKLIMADLWLSACPLDGHGVQTYVYTYCDWEHVHSQFTLSLLSAVQVSHEVCSTRNHKVALLSSQATLFNPPHWLCNVDASVQT